MTAVEHIKAARGGLRDTRGKVVAIQVALPLTAEQIDSLEQRVGLRLPDEFRTVLAFCGGIEKGCRLDVDFTGEGMAFEYKEIFPNGLPFAHDGCGNFWVLDVTPDTTQSAQIFFACHDPPVILYQSPDLASFLSELLSGSRSLIDDVSEDAPFDVWRRNPGVIDYTAACNSPDESVRSFAATLPEHFYFVDLRNVNPGMGFSWGRYGPQTEVRRHGYERIFAYAKPPQKTHRTFLAKLSGR